MKCKKLILTTLLLSGFALASCSNSNSSISYLNDTNSFLEAIKRGDSTIYVDKISFSEETQITLTHPVEVIGKNKESKIEKANFVLEGTLTLQKTTPFTFTNIIFDGGVDESKYDFSKEGKTFYEMFGSNRDDKRCFLNTSGYISLTLNNCEITRYAARIAPTIYIDNDEKFALSERYLNMDNCTIHHNICYEGAMQMFHEKGVSNIANSTFSDNLAKNAGGLVVSNGKGTLNNLEVKNNRFYRFVNNSADGTPIVPTDKLKVGDKEYNYVSLSGSLYIGGGDYKVTNSLFSGNKNLFGGAIGFTTSQAGLENERILFKDNIIINNEATYGGAIYSKTRSGNTVKFINCAIQNNKAEYGSIMYATTMAPWMKTFEGGVNAFEFSTMIGNTSKEKCDSFTFSELLTPEIGGKTELRGCFVIDDSTYQVSEINYVASKATALSDNVISEEDLNKVNEEIIYPKKGSKADISIAEETYKSWDNEYAEISGAKKAGYIKTTAENKTLKIVLIIVIPVAIVLVLAIVLFSLWHYRKRKEREKRDIEEKLASYTYEELFKITSKALVSYSLTNKEVEVATYLLICKKRKEIAEKLFVSQDTIKTHISHIFKKMNISSKHELRRIVNKYL